MDETQFFLDIHLKTLRNQRDKLLQDTDKYLLLDFPISPENLQLIKEYRQKLREYMNSPNINTEIIPFPSFPF